MLREDVVRRCWRDWGAGSIKRIAREAGVDRKTVSVARPRRLAGAASRSPATRAGHVPSLCRAAPGSWRSGIVLHRELGLGIRRRYLQQRRCPRTGLATRAQT
jgi:hypothetical protein